jgi:hypothetical protein
MVIHDEHDARCIGLPGRCDVSKLRNDSSICTPRIVGRAASITVLADAVTPVWSLRIQWENAKDRPATGAGAGQ